MVALPVSKRGTITLPPRIRHKWGLDKIPHPMVLAEEHEGVVYLQLAAPVSVRNFTPKQIKQWIKDDEGQMMRLKHRKK